MNIEQSPFRWRIAGFAVSVLLLMILLLYRETVLYLVGLWNELEIGEYGHGYMILAISGYLILRNRQTLAALNPCPFFPALFAVLGACLLWMLATLVDVQLLQVVGLFFLVLAVVWAVLGNQVTWVLLLPILFIGFAIPVWFPLALPLQDLSADVVFRIIRVLGIPAFRQDYDIVLPAGTLSITAACSGLRYLLPALALGVVYGYLNYTSARARLLVVLIAASAAVFVNMARVFVIVYLGYATDMQHPFVNDHLVLGWYLFGGMTVILLIVDARLHRQRESATAASAAATNKVLAPGCEKGKLRYLMVVLAGAALISSGPAVVYRANHQPYMGNKSFTLEFPPGVGVWAGPVVTDDDWMPEYHGAITRKQAYESEDERVYLFVGYYHAEEQGKELINDLNRLGSKDVWIISKPGGRLRQENDLMMVEQLLEKGDGEQRLVWYWYRVAGQQTTNRYQAKVLQLLGVLTGRTGASVVAVAINPDDGIDNARMVLGDFISAMKTPLAEITEHNR